MIVFFPFQSECLKHLLHNLRSDKSLLCDPVLALNRDSIKGKSSSNPSTSNATDSVGGKTSLSKKQISESVATQNDQTAHKLVALYNLVESQKSTLQRFGNSSFVFDSLLLVSRAFLPFYSLTLDLLDAL